MLLGQFVSHLFQGIPTRLRFIQVDHGEAVHAAEEVGDGVCLDDSVFQQDTAEVHAASAVQGLGVVELRRGDVARLAQQFADFQTAGTGLILDGPLGHGPCPCCTGFSHG